MSFGGSEHNQNAHGVSLTPSPSHILSNPTLIHIKTGRITALGTEEMVDLTGQMVGFAEARLMRSPRRMTTAVTPKRHVEQKYRSGEQFLPARAYCRDHRNIGAKVGYFLSGRGPERQIGTGIRVVGSKELG